MTQNPNDINLNQKDLESEIFAIIKTVENLYEKYQLGSIKEDFFQKSIRKALKGLLEFNALLHEKNMILSQLLKEINLVQEYDKVLNIINKAMIVNVSYENYQPFYRNQQEVKRRFFNLPKLTLEITSTFITMIDALKLGVDRDMKFILKLFSKLMIELDKFPGLTALKYKLNKMHENLILNQRELKINQKYREDVAEELYSLYKEFQANLDL